MNGTETNNNVSKNKGTLEVPIRELLNHVSYKMIKEKVLDEMDWLIRVAEHDGMPKDYIDGLKASRGILIGAFPRVLEVVQ